MTINLKLSSLVFHAILLVSIAAFMGDARGQIQTKESRPNILFILADDQGWNDLSVQMHDGISGSNSDYYRTPNIERISEGGMRFSSAYAAAPMCNQSRHGIHSGKSVARVFYAEAADEALAASMTLGEMMQSAGYATAHFGKWSPGPPAEGLRFYDVSDGVRGNGDGNLNEPGNPKDIFGITERAIAFMEESVNAGKPFYMQLSHFAPHVGVSALEETVEKWEGIAPGEIHTNPAYAAMTENLDTGIGMVLDNMRELGIEDNTYIIYTSDHGQAVNASTNLPLTQGKGTLWEGDMRVPFIVSGPGIIPGTMSDTRIVSLDLYPTFAEIAGTSGSQPGDLEGGSLVPVLNNQGKGEVQRPRKELVFHFPQPSGQPGSRGSSSIYLGDYKLMKFYDTGELLLFDITADPSEQNNLADQVPDIVDDMHIRMVSYLESVDARIPTPSEASGEGRDGGMGGGMGMGMGMGMSATQDAR
jgi:arylsulfatase A